MGLNIISPFNWPLKFITGLGINGLMLSKLNSLKEKDKLGTLSILPVIVNAWSSLIKSSCSKIKPLDLEDDSDDINDLLGIGN